MARGGCHCDGASPPATDGFVLKHLYEYTCDEWSTSINKKLLDREVGARRRLRRNSVVPNLYSDVVEVVENMAKV
jgi:hypothetical protein